MTKDKIRARLEWIRAGAECNFAKESITDLLEDMYKN